MKAGVSKPVSLACSPTYPLPVVKSATKEKAGSGKGRKSNCERSELVIHILPYEPVKLNFRIEEEGEEFWIKYKKNRI